MAIVPDPFDPRPQPPDKPLPMECCESGCETCVYDIYADELESYQRALEAWNSRHPEVDEGGTDEGR